MRTNPAIIHATLAVGSTATAPYYDVNITQSLCYSACADETPVFAPAFSVKSLELVGTSQYLATIHVEGAISYMPCGCGCCATRTQLLSQDFTLPIYGTGVSSVEVSAGATRNGIVKNPCAVCSKTFVSDTPLTLAITAS